MTVKRRRVLGSDQLGGSCRIIILITMGLLFLAGVGSNTELFAQTAEQPQRQRILDEPFRLRMDEQIPTEKRMLFDWGGWLRSSYWAIDEQVDRNFDGSDDGYHAMRLQQMRLWGYFNLDQAHQVYARGKLDYYDWNHGASYDHNDSDREGPNLERGWYNFRLSQYQYGKGQSPGDYDLGIKFGRQYVELGSGLALSVPLDALLVNGYYKNWQVTGLGAFSIPSTHNIDRSVPGNSKESRNFWGTQLRYNGYRNHEPFVYYFAQEDKDGGAVRLDQRYGYDSEYLGAGSRGQFFHRDLQYTLELVSECGDSYADSPGETNQQRIRAWALDTELRYLMNDDHLSQLAVEFVLASGDTNRTFSPTNTVGGNQPHSVDTSFSGWGFRNTGMVLAPRMSNLNSIRLGASTFPVNHIELFKDLEVATNFFLYHKNESSGAASDSLSVNDNDFLGSEFDLFLNWRITSDLAWSLQYGVFFPGDAFLNRDDRHLFFTGLLLSF
ncbi:MAG: alginate export family protein [Planctomycetes bacterium]|nr:alginate export family protein [Planctomycetota bacterium]